MPDPTLKRTSVVVKYTGSDGYRMETEAKGGPGSKNLRTLSRLSDEMGEEL